jgi:hypothetical protein
MTTMSEKIEKTEKKEKAARRTRTLSTHGAAEKCRAVLSLWAGKRKPGELCREYAITYTLLNLWEKRAMEGMLQALEPRINLERGPALSPRLQALLEKKSMRQGRLEERLARIQEKKEPKEV